MKKSKDGLKKVITAFLIVIIIFSGYKILLKLYRYKVDNDTYTEIRHMKDTIDEKQKNNIMGSTEENLNSRLKKENSNYVFWIKVKGTKIDYPVVQGEDNEFYLNHDFYKKENFSGTLFLDYRTSRVNNDNLIVYGHNMRDGSMFHDLDKFKDKNFIKDNNEIRLESSEGVKTYKIFSVYIESGYNDFFKLSFASKEEKIDYLNNVKKKSIYNIEEDIKENIDIITLSTCSYEFDEARIIIHGKKVY